MTLPLCGSEPLPNKTEIEKPPTTIKITEQKQGQTNLKYLHQLPLILECQLYTQHIIDSKQKATTTENCGQSHLKINSFNNLPKFNPKKPNT
jgi:hypothetical protein